MRNILLYIFLFFPVATNAAQRPKIVINIVVGGMRADYIQRFERNLTTDGFNRFVKNGVVYTNARYDFMTTIPPSTLATLATGANPAEHGIVGRQWIDAVSGNTVDLIADHTAHGLYTEPNEGGYYAVNQVVETIGDRLLKEYSDARVITVAADPVNAITLGGRSSEVYWIDNGMATWISSDKYMPVLPDWVKTYNSQAYERGTLYQRFEWMPILPTDKYVNRRYSRPQFADKQRQFVLLRQNGTYPQETKRYSEVMQTPVESEFVANFVRHIITYSGVGKDAVPDILNIYFGNLRRAGEEYGAESVELEDAFYRLDRALSMMISFIQAQFGEQVLFVLTSDGGLSSSFDAAGERDRFNAEQFRIIANSFLSAHYGGSNWVLAYNNRKIYLNRSQAFRLGLNLAEISERLASFVIQFRGVANVLTASAMNSGGFSDPIRRRVQNSYYPSRSGDVILSLAPGWIELSDGVRAQSGSLYDYDVHVPLMFVGAGLKSEQVTRSVDMTSLAVTLAEILHINRPEAAMGETLSEVVSGK